MQKPPLLLLLGSVHPWGRTVAEVCSPGVCKTLWGPLTAAAGPRMYLGVPAPLGGLLLQRLHVEEQGWPLRHRHPLSGISRAESTQDVQ